MRTARIAPFVATLCAAALLAMGCGNDGGEHTSETSTQATAELTGDPVVVYTIGEFSAGIAAPEIPEGLEAGLEAINRAGGLPGERPVQLEVCDTEDDPNTAAGCARAAVDAGAVAVLGSFTLHGSEVLPILEDAQIPSLGLVPLTAVDFVSPAAYPVDGGLVTGAGGVAYALADEGHRRIAIARSDLPEAAALVDFAQMALDNFGLELVADVPVPMNSPDMAPYIAAVREADADGVIVGMDGADADNFAIAWRQAEPDAGLGMLVTDLTALFDALGNISDIVTAGAYLEDPELEAIATYRKNLEAVGVSEPGDFRDDVYVSTLVFDQVARSVSGELTAPSLWAALNEATDIRTGFTPPVSFTPESGGVAGLPRIFNPCVAIYHGNETDGKFIDPFAGEACPGV